VIQITAIRYYQHMIMGTGPIKEIIVGQKTHMTPHILCDE